MGELGVIFPVITGLALVVLVLRLREPDRRRPPAAAVEVLSVTLTAGLLVELTLAGSGWARITATTSLYALFGATVAFVLAMARVVVAVVRTRRPQQVPLDAVVSFGAVSAVAALLSGAMVVAAFGWVVAGVIATVAVLRAAARPWTAVEVLRRWRFDDRQRRGPRPRRC